MSARHVARFQAICKTALIVVAGSCAFHVAPATSCAQDPGAPPAILSLQFADDFQRPLDPQHWTVRGTCHSDNGYLRIDANRQGPPGPSQTFTFSYLDLKQKCLNPGLRGTGGAEITLVRYSHETDYPKELETSVVREHRMGWGMTLASWRGQIGQNNPEDRGVQLHIDSLGRFGLFVSFVRSLVPEDAAKYPNDNVWRVGPDEFRAKQDLLIEEGPFISEPCLVMACRIYRPAQKFLDSSHRFGLYLADDANTAYWTLDGRRMDSFDVGDYFRSSPQATKDGLFLTIAGAGIYQQNTFKMDDLKIYADAGPFAKE
jgi:hypothetical protein